jgi:N6-L-threonylcarbamoyladenine synthase
MLILGIETSCDDTAAAVVRDGHEVLSSIVSTQDQIHAPFGGIVPEMASRSHLEKIDNVVAQAIDKADLTLSEIDLVAVTAGPGLIGSLLVGLSFAKGLSFAMGLPLVPVDHIQGHLMTLDLADGTPFPSVALVASGGHTTLFELRSPGSTHVVGTTLDDAAGEALDKAAKLLGLGYPGGPAIEKAAQTGDPEALALPRPLMQSGNLDFSFSGLKTALFTYLQRHGYLDRTTVDRPRLPLSTADLAASYMEAVVDVLVSKCRIAVKFCDVPHLLVVGGVARNSHLREKMEAAGSGDGFQVHFPPPSLCTDNAAMVAAMGYRTRKKALTNVLDLNAYSTKSLRARGPRRKRP